MTNTLSAAELRAMLAAAEQAETEQAEQAAAEQAVSTVLSDAVAGLASLAAGARAAGLSVDLGALLAAAVSRAAPVSPETLAAVIAPQPEPVREDLRRTRNRIVHDMTRIESGLIWDAALAGQTGRVKIVVAADGPVFIATTGARGSYRSPSRAVQASCGNPAGTGRRGEATVNGYVALTAPDGVTTLDAATRVVVA